MASNRPVTGSDIAKLVGYKNTTSGSNLLRLLAGQGYLERLPGGAYLRSDKPYPMSNRTLAEVPVVEASKTLMAGNRSLYEQTKDAALQYLMDGGEPSLKSFLTYLKAGDSNAQ